MDFFTHLYSEPYAIALSSIVLVNAAQTVHLRPVEKCRKETIREGKIEWKV